MKIGVVYVVTYKGDGWGPIILASADDMNERATMLTVTRNAIKLAPATSATSSPLAIVTDR